MAQRRMFDKEQIFSDHFAAMRPTTQLAYFKLCMSADDDGFVSSAKQAGATEKILKELADYGLIFRFETKLILIRHWLMHNQIRKDTYKPTVHIAEKTLITLGPEKIYYLEAETRQDQNGTVLVPQIRKDKIRKENKKIEKKAPTENAAVTQTCEKDFEIFWAAYPNKTGKAEALKIFKKTDPPLEALLTGLESHKKSRHWQSDGGLYIPKAANWLKKRQWEDPVRESAALWGASGQPGEAERDMIRQIMANA